MNSELTWQSPELNGVPVYSLTLDQGVHLGNPPSRENGRCDSILQTNLLMSLVGAFLILMYHMYRRISNVTRPAVGQAPNQLSWKGCDVAARINVGSPHQCWQPA